MKQPIENIAVIGTGVIGAGWIIRFLFNQKIICVYDPQLKQKKFLVNQITIEENLIDYTYLLIYLIFDIFLRAKFSKINFLDQPAVEILKKNTRA